MNIKAERERLGISQVKMAAGIGISLNAYLRWEHNVGNPNDENMEKVIAFLKKEDDRRG